MPLAQLRVMEVISLALTPSGPPIYSMASHKSTLVSAGHAHSMTGELAWTRLVKMDAYNCMHSMGREGAPRLTSSASLNVKLP